MSLSAHELILVLRARDEASRVLRSFSTNMATAGRSASNSQIASLMRTAEAARLTAESQLDGFRQNRLASKQSIQDVRSRIKSVRLEDQVQAATMRAQVARLNNNSQLSDETRRRQIKSLRQVREQQKAVAVQEVASLEQVAAVHQRRIMGYDREVQRIQEVKRSSDIQTRAELNNIRQKMKAEEANVQRVQDAAHAQFSRGAAVATVGVAMTGVGIAGAAALNSMTDAASAYNEESAKTLTQVDGLGFSLDDIKRMGQDLARDFPVKMEEVQASLYDVFSSMDFRGKNAKKNVDIIYRGIAKAAVAGAVSMDVAGRSIIPIMNAWQLKGKDVNRVNDVMFKLVQKGVGTYGQFANTIGRAVPSAKKAGQSVEDLAGMMAFLTRNGLSTAQSATSAARALDSISKKSTQENLKELGVRVTDASGKFRPMVDIVQELSGKLEGMNDKAKADTLNNIFGRGTGGTTQAMKFFNLALTDTDKLLPQLTTDMKGAAGATDEAYAIMSNTPAAKLQEMNNEYKIMTQRLGDELIPIKLALVKAITGVLEKFNELNPGAQRFIVISAAVVAGLFILVGLVLTVAGAIAMLGAAASLAGGAAGLGAMLTPVGWIVAALAALIAIGILVAQNWDAISAKAQETWGGMQRVIQPFVDQFMIGWAQITAGWDWFMTAIRPGIDQLVAAFTNLGNNIAPILNWIVGILLTVFLPVWQIVAGTIGGILGGLGVLLSGFLQVISGVINFIVALFTGNFSAMGAALLQIFGGMWRMIVGIIQTIGGAIGGIVSGIIRAVIGFFTYLYNVLVGHSIVPDMIMAIVSWFARLPGWAIGAISSLAGRIFSTAKDWLGRMLSAVQGGWSAVSSFFSGIPGKIVSAIGGVGNLLYNAGQNILQGFLNGLRSIWDNITGFIGNIASWIAAHKGPLSYDYGLLQPAGHAIMGGLEFALRKRFGNIRRTFKDINNLIDIDGNGSYTANDFGRSEASVPTTTGRSTSVKMTVNTQEINPVKHAADLAFIVANDLGL